MRLTLPQALTGRCRLLLLLLRRCRCNAGDIGTTRPLGVYDQGRFTRGATSLWVHRGNWHTGLPPRMGIATEVVVHRLVPA